MPRPEKSEGILCPWCPPNKAGDKVYIHYCQHNPFKLMAEVAKLNNEVYKNQRAAILLEELRSYLIGGCK